MVLSITNLRKGTVFQLDGVPYRVVEYSHKVMGRGSASVNIKIKSLIDGKVLTKTFHGNDSVENANVSQVNMQYLYKDDRAAYFMDESSYAQFEIPMEYVGDQLQFMKEGEPVQVQLFDGRPIGVELPKNVPLKVTYAENVVRGDTSTAITKEAELETGIRVKVPAFIKTGDVISVDTSTGAYRERVK